ncbi:MAG: NAD(P)/FAD-dependent oxidoreductase, partial [Oscillospiraceae bacterium]|nr:NAD(P)/FAD-dependent oxidoreductase [Oscillospiraceae bacterium]
KEYELHLNLVSDLLVHEVENYLNVMVQHNVQLSDLLSGLLPKRVGEEIIRACCKDPFRRKASSLNDSEREKVARTLRNWTFKVKSLGPVNLAQISKGGVMELDSQTLASQRNTGLFYCGEVVNVDGECGGYNLHWAWISGQAAGKAACDYLTRVRGAADEV